MNSKLALAQPKIQVLNPFRYRNLSTERFPNIEKLRYCMQKEKLKDILVIVNEKGLHTRPATELVKCAATFKAQVTLYYQDLCVNAKSLLGILMLAAARGAKIRIEAEGEDAKEAIESLLVLAKNKFNIKY